MKSNFKRWPGFGALIAGLFLGLCGCRGNLPSAAIMAVHHCPDVLLNGCESLTENGSWTGVNAVRSITTLNATQGTHSLDADITTASGYNQVFLNLGGFTPVDWSGMTQLLMDATVDPSVVAGAGYHQMLLMADASGAGKYFVSISSTVPNLNAGLQTLTWNLDFPSSILPTDSLTAIYFVYNNNSTNGTGHFYADNLRLVPNCP
jgi:hypothetical protein